MQDEILNNRITELEKRLKSLEEKENSNFDDNSVIALLLDVFNIKRFLKTLFTIQNSYRITDNLISVILFFLLIVFIFWQNDMLHLNKISAITTLGIIFIAGFFEFLGANTSIFRSIFIKGAKTKSFLEKIPCMSSVEIEDSLKNINFSSMCMDYFIKQLEDKNKYSPKLVYMILDSQVLRTQNLDLLFSQRIIKNLHPSLVIRVLYRRRDFLDVQCINNIYDQFKNNTKVLKVLFATQKYSDCLLEAHPERTELRDFFENYQIQKAYLDNWLKLFPHSHLRIIYKTLTLSLIIGLSFVFTILEFNNLGINTQLNYLLIVNFVKSADLLMVNFIISALITLATAFFLIVPIFKLADKKYYSHYVHKVTTS